MLLLPGSLPPDRATLKALCERLAELPEVAASLRGATVTECSGSWSDAEREAADSPGDLPDGVILAQEVLQTGNEIRYVAIATPLHAALGLTDLTPVDPSMLSLSADESRELCEAADAHMREDGVRVHFVDAGRWLLSCKQAVEVLTERPDWIVGELLRPNLPRGRDARLVERWMNELQMLLHAHTVNIAREAQRLPPVNLVWLWGFGLLDLHKKAKAAGAAPQLSHLHALRNGDVPAWQKAWQTVSPEILSAQTIMLGDSQPRLRLTVTKPGITSSLLAVFKRKPTLAEALTKLQQAR